MDRSLADQSIANYADIVLIIARLSPDPIQICELWTASKSLMRIYQKANIPMMFRQNEPHLVKIVKLIDDSIESATVKMYHGKNYYCRTSNIYINYYNKYTMIIEPDICKITSSMYLYECFTIVTNEGFSSFRVSNNCGKYKYECDVRSTAEHRELVVFDFGKVLGLDIKHHDFIEPSDKIVQKLFYAIVSMLFFEYNVEYGTRYGK